MKQYSIWLATQDVHNFLQLVLLFSVRNVALASALNIRRVPEICFDLMVIPL